MTGKKKESRVDDLMEKTGNISAEISGYKILKIDETEYRTLYSGKYEKKKPYIPRNTKRIFSVIPGTVVEIPVKPGQRVSAGDTIVILDAMKMMNRIIIPQNGTIKKIFVKKGEVIPKKHLIAELR